MGIAGFLGKSQELMLSDLRCYHHRAVDSCAAVSTVCSLSPTVRLSCSNLMTRVSLTTVRSLGQTGMAAAGSYGDGFQCAGLTVSKTRELLSYTEESFE